METIVNTDIYAPIGVFDSGLGGLSVCGALIAGLPAERFVYFADSANCPYGAKKQDEIIRLSKRIVHFLLEKKCKLIVVACNTATAMAIEYLRKNYGIPFVGMEPAIKPAAMQSSTGIIGILATEGTIKGKHFNDTKARLSNKIKVITTIGNGLVELVEQGKIGTNESRELLSIYIAPMIEQGADTLVLGCTHYPFLSDDINIVSEGKLTLIDSATAIVHRVGYILQQSGMNCKETENKPIHSFFTSGKSARLIDLLKYIGLLNYEVTEINL